MDHRFHSRLRLDQTIPPNGRIESFEWIAATLLCRTQCSQRVAEEAQRLGRFLVPVEMALLADRLGMREQLSDQFDVHDDGRIGQRHAELE